MSNLPKLDTFHRADVVAGIEEWLLKQRAFQHLDGALILENLVQEMNTEFKSTGLLPWEEKPVIKSADEVRLEFKTKHLQNHTDNPCAYERDEFKECHFCGTPTCQKGYESDGERHWLSDCRPDLVEHEIGDTCTWAFRREETDFPENHTCYGYQADEKIIGQNKWTDSHSHFYPDGPC